MNISEQIRCYVNEYKVFMDIIQFPMYALQTQEVSQAKADSQGFESAASTEYQIESGTHTLFVSTNLMLSKHLMFHEFTHILDSELYANNDKIQYLGLTGYTEYHASQVELVQLLGAKSINNVPSFSMNRKIFPFEREKTVLQYVQERYQFAIDLFSKSNFPGDIDTLKAALGVLFNYWGLRSICEMYSSDFVEKNYNEAFLRFIPNIYFTLLNNLMHGWLNDKEIYSSIPLYINTVYLIIKLYKL